MKKSFLLFIIIMISLLIYSCDSNADADELLQETSETDETDDVSFSCSAGDDQSNTVLGQTIILTGSVSNTASESIVYDWTASGNNPSAVNLLNKETSEASFDITLDLAEGDYEYTLRAFDGENYSMDSVVIKVDYVKKILALDPVAYAWFGVSVSLSADGKTALIGTNAFIGATAVSRTEPGSAYIFTYDGSIWIQEAKLTAYDDATDNNFGNSVSLSSDGTTALIGAFGDDSKGTDSGSAYIFTYDGSIWIEETKLIASDTVIDDRFGNSVSLSSDGTTALIGAYWDDGNGNYSGSAYIFTSSGSSWTQKTKLTALDTEDNSRFGYSVSLSADGITALIGAYYDDNISGSAYIFTYDGSDWTQKTKLTALNAADHARFGNSVSLSANGTTALIGAYYDDNAAPNSGSAYIFTYDGSDWIQKTNLIAYDAGDSDCFGTSVILSADGTTALIGAKGSGSAYIFTYDGSDWTQKGKLGGYGWKGWNSFGCSISLSADGTTTLIGEYLDDETYIDSGSVSYCIIDY